MNKLVVCVLLNATTLSWKIEMKNISTRRTRKEDIYSFSKNSSSDTNIEKHAWSHLVVHITSFLIRGALELWVWVVTTIITEVFFFPPLDGVFKFIKQCHLYFAINEILKNGIYNAFLFIFVQFLLVFVWHLEETSTKFELGNGIGYTNSNFYVC